MSQFTQSELKRYEWGGLLVAILGLAMALFGRRVYDSEVAGSEYILALRNVGWLILALGVIWTALSSARLRTTFFSLDRKMSSTAAGASLAGILVVVILLYVLLIPRLPTTPPDKMSPDPNARATVTKQEKNFKYLAAAAILLTALLVGFYPARKFLKN